jgi:hypothetical protein
MWKNDDNNRSQKRMFLILNNFRYCSISEKILDKNPPVQWFFVEVQHVERQNIKIQIAAGKKVPYICTQNWHNLAFVD